MKSAHQVMLATVLSLISSSAMAQSDTTEARTSDVKPSTGTSESAEDFVLRKDAVRGNIDVWYRRVQAKTDKLEQSLQGLDLKKIQNQQVVIKDLLSILDELDEEAQSIQDAQGQIGPDLQNYRQALLKAPAVFRTFSEQFAKRASEVATVELKETYAEFASQARTFATTYEKKAAGVGTVEKELAKKIEYVKESRVFIADIRGFLEAVPPDGQVSEKIVDRINKYIEAFDDAVRALKGVSERIGEPESKSNGPSKPAKAVPLTKATTPLAPTNQAEYQQRLAQLKR